MDKAAVFGTVDGGSIPSKGTATPGGPESANRRFYISSELMKAMDHKPLIKIIILGIVILAVAGTAAQWRRAPRAYSEPDLKTLALQPADLPGFSLVAESQLPAGRGSLRATDGYLVNYDNAVSTGGKSAPGYRDLSNSIFKFSTPADLHEDFARQSKGSSMVQVMRIGDESIAYKSGGIAVVWFRKGNVMAGVSLAGGSVEEVAQYASIVEQHIK